MGRGRGSYDSPSIPTPSAEDLRRIVQGDAVTSAEMTVRWASKLGNDLKNAGLTTSQIRTVFGQVRQIEMSWPLEGADSDYAQAAYRDLILLKPKLAYQAGRAKEQRSGGDAVQTLADLLIAGIDLVDGSRSNFQRFVDFFEAILAYHKAAGGK